jgi:enoyl-CoA hydratase
MADTDEILLGRKGGLAMLTINRPQALNALTLDNYRRIDPALHDWAADPSVHAVVVRGAGDRAFCAGGDVRAVYEAGCGISGDPDLPAVFFREEYELIRRIHRFPKPYIAVIDGITMGGGAGISVNGAYRVATDRTLLAMPETGIGLFPDVGATRFLNRCPGHVGRHLGLTGARVNAADALYCGFATHFMRHDRLEDFVAGLDALGERPGEARWALDRVLARFVADPGPAELPALQPAIDRCFGEASVEAIVAALEREEGEWARTALAAIGRASPLSLKITFRQLEFGRGMDLEAALALEYRMTQHVMAGHDFYEGIRALLVDKDQKPRWEHASLAEVSDAEVESYFAEIGERELRFA